MNPWGVLVIVLGVFVLYLGWTGTQPNSKSNPQANANGSLPGGSYPGLVQPGSPGSATNKIYGS